jgi:hypothetical protein
MKHYIFGLDHVLVDITQRMHFIGSDAPDRIEQFHAAADDDVIVDHVAAIFNSLPRDQVHIWAFRREKFREQTVNFLKRHFQVTDEWLATNFRMRPDDFKGVHSANQRLWLAELHDRGIEVECAFDWAAPHLSLSYKSMGIPYVVVGKEVHRIFSSYIEMRRSINLQEKAERQALHTKEKEDATLSI